MKTTLASLLVAALLLPGAALTVAPAPAAAALTAVGVESVAGAEQAVPEGPPRTLRAHWHVFAAFAAAWILLFGYLIWIAVRLRRAEQSVAEIAARAPGSSA